jgi:hypothetical protein
MLACLLNKELDSMGYKLSIHRMLDLFQTPQQVTSVYLQFDGKPVVKTNYSRFEGIPKEYVLMLTLNDRILTTLFVLITCS